MIRIEKDVICGQSAGSFLCIHIRYTRILFKRFWSTDKQKQGVQIYIFAPKHDPKTGYSCTKFGIKWRNK